MPPPPPPHLCVSSHQQMRRTGNKDENKRILMDLDVVLKSHDCPYIIQCYGAIVTNVSVPSSTNQQSVFEAEQLVTIMASFSPNFNLTG